jgi:heme/copper-type cytochrome/quinol oxidase subunit 2
MHLSRLSTPQEMELPVNSEVLIHFVAERVIHRGKRINLWV